MLVPLMMWNASFSAIRDNAGKDFTLKRSMYYIICVVVITLTVLFAVILTQFFCNAGILQ